MNGFASYELMSDEFVLLKDKYVHFQGTYELECSFVTLTNKRIICEYGTYREPLVYFFPLDTIKVYQGKPQLLISGDSFQWYLDIYFTNASEKLRFGEIFRSKKQKLRIQEWIDAITPIVAALPPKPVEVEPIVKNNVNSNVNNNVSNNVIDGKYACPNCGKMIKASSKFCYACGFKIESKQGFDSNVQEDLMYCLKKLLKYGVITEQEYSAKMEYIKS